MKIKILIFGLFFLAGLLFSMPVFAYTYTRTPAGYNSYNPVTLYLNASYEEIKTICGCSDFNVARFKFSKDVGGEISSQWYASTTLEKIWTESHPLGGYGSVTLQCSIDPNQPPFICGGGSLAQGTWNIGLPPPPPPPPPIITLPTNMATSMLAYAGQSFSDLAPLLLIGIGLMLAFWLISNALRLTNILDKTKSKKINSWDFFDKEQKEKFRKDDWL
jgi:hypothetical protein